MIKIGQKGNFSKVTAYLERVKDISKVSIFDKYGRLGVEALSSATPVDTGLTAKSWQYEVERSGSTVSISFYNTNVNNGVPIAIILQLGHAARDGSWVTGIDYINPALKPVFDNLSKELWKEVTRT